MALDNASKELLKGAYDIHIHCAPDVIKRSQDVFDLARDAAEAGMAGVGVKDHTASTAGQAYVLNRLYPGGPRFFSYITLNPPTGGLNPAAVEAALRSGADIVCFPSYSARRNIEVLAAAAGTPGAQAPETRADQAASVAAKRPATAAAGPLPVNGKNFTGISILGSNGALKPQVSAILRLIKKYDAVLATGHLSPQECLTLIKKAKAAGIGRIIATHASQPAPGLSVEEQKEAAACGAFIEHSFLVVTNGIPSPISLELLRDQIRGVGVDKVILSSDFGKASLDKPLEGFALYLQKLLGLGFTREELSTMVCENPRRLLGGRLKPE